MSCFSTLKSTYRGRRYTVANSDMTLPSVTRVSSCLFKQRFSFFSDFSLSSLPEFLEIFSRSLPSTKATESDVQEMDSFYSCHSELPQNPLSLPLSTIIECESEERIQEAYREPRVVPLRVSYLNTTTESSASMV